MTSLNPCFVGMWSFREFARAALSLCCCLNPCFVGMWSFSMEIDAAMLPTLGLNPCFVGMWSFSANGGEIIDLHSVLILVLLGCGLLATCEMALLISS